MLVNNKSISGIVKDIVGCNISFQDSLQRNYCNISALARILKPEMDKLLDKNVSLESIITALKRLRKIYKKNHSGTPIFSILAGSMISVKTDVTKLSASKSKNTIEKIGKALRRN